MTLKAEYSLNNLIVCMEMLEDARNPNNSIIINRGYKWLVNRVKTTGELSTPDREHFHEKYYLKAKNK